MTLGGNFGRFQRNWIKKISISIFQDGGAGTKYASSRRFSNLASPCSRQSGISIEVREELGGISSFNQKTTRFIWSLGREGVTPTIFVLIMSSVGF